MQGVLSRAHYGPETRRILRPLPLLFALLGHTGAVLLFLLIERRGAPDSSEPALVYVLPITQTPVARPAAITPDPRQRARQSASTPLPEAAAPTSTEPASTPEPAAAPTTAPAPAATISLPATDWRRELQAAARRSVAPDSADPRQHSLDSRPKVLELPKVSEDPPPGTVVLAPNGDRIVRYKNGWTCTSSDPPLAEHFSVWAQHRPPKCRLGAKPETKLDVARPRYLEPSLPDPGSGVEPDPLRR